MEGQPQAPVIATQIEAPTQPEGRYRQEREDIPVGQSALKGHRPRDSFSEGGRLEVVLPSKGQPHQGPAQPVQQRKPPLAAGRRRNLGIHARNSAAPAASGNAHSSTHNRRPFHDGIFRGSSEEKALPDCSRRAFQSGAHGRT